MKTVTSDLKQATIAGIENAAVSLLIGGTAYYGPSVIREVHNLLHPNVEQTFDFVGDTTRVSLSPSFLRTEIKPSFMTSVFQELGLAPRYGYDAELGVGIRTVDKHPETTEADIYKSMKAWEDVYAQPPHMDNTPEIVSHNEVHIEEYTTRAVERGVTATKFSTFGNIQYERIVERNEIFIPERGGLGLTGDEINLILLQRNPF